MARTLVDVLPLEILSDDDRLVIAQQMHLRKFRSDDTLFFFSDPAPAEIYTTANTLSLHDALPISARAIRERSATRCCSTGSLPRSRRRRSEEHTSELQSLAVISYAVFCLKKK